MPNADFWRSVCVPVVPHDWVQVLQPAQSSTMQSDGQRCALQPSVSSECGQAAPPLDGVPTWRERDL